MCCCWTCLQPEVQLQQQRQQQPPGLESERLPRQQLLRPQSDCSMSCDYNTLPALFQPVLCVSVSSASTVSRPSCLQAVSACAVRHCPIGGALAPGYYAVTPCLMELRQIEQPWQIYAWDYAGGQPVCQPEQRAAGAGGAGATARPAGGPGASIDAAGSGRRQSGRCGSRRRCRDCGRRRQRRRRRRTTSGQPGGSRADVGRRQAAGGRFATTQRQVPFAAPTTMLQGTSLLHNRICARLDEVLRHAEGVTPSCPDHVPHGARSHTCAMQAQAQQPSREPTATLLIHKPCTSVAQADEPRAGAASEPGWRWWRRACAKPGGRLGGQRRRNWRRSGVVEDGAAAGREHPHRRRAAARYELQHISFFFVAATLAAQLQS